MRVLVVQPEGPGWEQLQELVHQAGDAIQLEQETDFEPALARLLRTECEVALVAEETPGGGLELIRRAVAEGCRLPFLLVADEDDPELDRAALAAGASGFLVLQGLTVRGLVRSLRYARTGYESGERRSRELLEQFARYLSHEGKNALAGIRAGLQVLGAQLTLEGTEAEILAEIHTRLAQWQETVDDLNLLVRPVRPALVRVQLDALLREAVAAVTATLAEPRLIQVEGPSVALQADRRLLRRLFQAVVHNAVDAVAARAGKVRISWDLDGGSCRVEVRDGGPGLSLDPLEAVRPFVSTKPRAPGLGLPVARRIARAHGGDLRLREVPEGGVTVEVDLPAAPGDGGQA